MLFIAKGGPIWESAKAQIPPTRAVWVFFTRTRFLLCLALAGIILLICRGLNRSASDMQRFYCWGPPKPPMLMSPNEVVEWNAHLQTPVVFNHHEPLVINESTIKRVNLNPITSTSKAVLNEERVLILTPLRYAASYLPKYFDLLSELTYPHHLIDLGFLVSDSSDDTLAVLSAELQRIQKQSDTLSEPFRSALIVEKDFGTTAAQTVEERHSFSAQASRRKIMARARNYLLSATLKPEHSWVYWRDVDVVDSPQKILEDLVAHNRDIIVPNVWFHRYKDGKDIEGRFDYNSWIESDKALRLAKSLPKDSIIVEGMNVFSGIVKIDWNLLLTQGYKEYDTGRAYMARMGDWRNNKDEEIKLDGIGGVNIVVKADVHRSGINFPCYAFENQVETEGFAKMAKRAGYEVIGLPNYVIWHIDTEEKPGNG